MLRKLRRRIKARDGKSAGKLAAAMALAVALAGTPAPTRAALGPQSFNDGAAHTVTDNIVAAVDGTPGLRVENIGTSVAMTGHSIATAGTTSYGVWANNGAITLSGVTIATTGGDSAGVLAHDGGAITLSGVTIATTGSRSSGVYAFENGSTVAMTGGSIATTGTTSYGVWAYYGATVTMTGGSIATAGSDSHGVLAAYNGAITLTNVAVTATGANSYALYAYGDGAPATVTATVDGQAVSGAGGLMYAYGGGAVSLIAAGASRLYGTTVMNNGGTAGLTLGGSAAWAMPGSSSLTTLTLNGGSVAFTAPAAGSYKTLAVGGNLAGSGGTFRLNADLAAGTADLVEIHGAASGSHQLFIAGQGSPSDRYRVVKIVDLNEAAINTATFVGGGDIGAWRYSVAPGSAISAYSGVGSLTDYYLYNTFALSTPARAAIGDSAAGTVVWYGEMNEIKKRLGDLRMGVLSGDDFWVRTYADKFNIRPGGAYAFSQLVRGIEVGKDSPQPFTGGKKFTGFVVGAGEADNTFSAGGTGEVRSVYAGAYGSWLRDDGAYFDLVGKYNWFRHSFSSPVLGGGSDSGSYRNTGLGLSAEIGKRIERGNGVFVQPEAELSALWSGRASYTSANGLAVEVPAADSLQLRLGCTVGRKWQDGDGASRQVYGKLSWVNEFRGDSRTMVDSVLFDASLKGHQWVTGVGFVEDGKHYQLYVDVEKSWGSAVSKAWGCNAGYRWKL